MGATTGGGEHGSSGRTRPIRGRARLVVALALATATVAACSADGDGAGGATAPPAAAAPAPDPGGAATPAVAVVDGGSAAGSPADTGPGAPVAELAAARARSFRESFDGAPSSPRPWQPADWDVTVHSRGAPAKDRLDPMHAGHGADCAGPPATHAASTYDDAVFLCRDHVMTAINGEEYGVVYLTPDRLVDLRGDAVVRFDMSTLRTSVRDWVDLWISPYEEQLQVPFESADPDLNGPPRRAIHVAMTSFDGGTGFTAEVYDDFTAQPLPSTHWDTYEERLVPDAARRDTFELRIGGGRLRFGMPAHDLWWVDAPLPALDWSFGVVQLGHHSYTPSKDCGGCGPNTWHWDEVVIEPAIPFTMLRGDRRVVDATTTAPVRFPSPAPAGARLRFVGIGEDIEVSTDGGRTWRQALLQQQFQEPPDEHVTSYWTWVPPGTSQVRFRGSPWWGGGWEARDISIWAPPGA